MLIGTVRLSVLSRGEALVAIVHQSLDGQDLTRTRRSVPTQGANATTKEPGQTTAASPQDPITCGLISLL